MTEKARRFKTERFRFFPPISVVARFDIRTNVTTININGNGYNLTGIEIQGPVDRKTLKRELTKLAKEGNLAKVYQLLPGRV